MANPTRSCSSNRIPWKTRVTGMKMRYITYSNWSWTPLAEILSHSPTTVIGTRLPGYTLITHRIRWLDASFSLFGVPPSLFVSLSPSHFYYYFLCQESALVPEMQDPGVIASFRDEGNMSCTAILPHKRLYPLVVPHLISKNIVCNSDI